MKKIFSTLALCAIIATSCTEKPVASDTDANDYTIAVSSEMVSFGPDGGTTEVTITSSEDWRAVNREDWVTLSATEGKSGDKLSISVQGNDGEYKETIVKVFTGNAVSEIFVASNPQYVLEFIGNDSTSIDVNGGIVAINLNTNISDLSYEIEGNEDNWIEFYNGGPAFNKYVYKFSAAANPKYTDRTAKIRFTGKDTSLVATLTQNMLPAIILDTNYIKYDLNAVEPSIKIQTNLDLEISKDSEWITVGGLETVSTLENGLTEYSLPVQISASTESRIGTITLSSTSPALSYTLTIKQQNPDAIMAEMPDSKLRDVLQEQGLIMVGNATSSEVELTNAGVAATSISLSSGNYSGYGITSLEGLESFPNVIELDATNNKLTSVDVSNMPKLEKLTLSTNFKLALVQTGDSPVKEIRIDNMFTIADVVIEGSNIESIAMEGSDWDQSWETFRTLDISSCPALKTLDITNHKKMTNLYVAEGQEEQINIINLPENAEITVR